MQSSSFRIWTRVTVSISYGDNHYTDYIYIYIYRSRLIGKSKLRKNENNTDISNDDSHNTTATFLQVFIVELGSLRGTSTYVIY